MESEQERLIYNAWRDSEAYQVPMTEEGEKLAQQRYYGFKQGWLYKEFYDKHGNIYKKDSDENYTDPE